MGSTRSRGWVASSLAVTLALVLVQAGAARPRDLPPQPRKQYTATDMARASSALIRDSDLLPEFQVDPQKLAKPTIPHCSDYPGDRSDITITGSASSAFRYRSAAIGSTTMFFRRYLDADSYWRKTARPAYAPCLARDYATSRGRGVRARTLMAKQIPLGPTSADAGMALRIATHLSGNGFTPLVWYQTIVFVRVARSVTIIAVDYASEPCTCYTSLATTIAGRLREANH